MNIKAKIVKKADFTFKILIVLLGVWIIYRKLFVNQNLTELLREIQIILSDKDNFILVSFAFLLMPVNIYIEALKWKLQLIHIEKISNWKSILSIFTGNAAGMFFPNRMGNFIGRVFMLEKGDRIKASLTTLVGGMAQMITTVSFGLFSVPFFVSENKLLIIFVSVIVVSLLLLVYFNIKTLRYVKFIIPSKFKNITDNYLQVFSNYSKMELLMILTISFLRYLVYTLQFVLLIWAFNIPLTYINAMIPISLTYLLMMIIPFITITEIAVRGSVSIFVFEKWLFLNGINSSYGKMVFFPSSLLWILNIAIPAIIGLFLTYRLKFFRNKNEL